MADYITGPTGTVTRNGVKVLEYDDIARVFTRRSDAGAVLEGPRAYTVAENAVADIRVAETVASAEVASLKLAVKAVVTEVKTEKDALDLRFPAGITNTTINANPGSYIKDVEKALERTMRAVIDLAKLVGAT